MVSASKKSAHGIIPSDGLGDLDLDMEGRVRESFFKCASRVLCHGMTLYRLGILIYHNCLLLICLHCPPMALRSQSRVSAICNLPFSSLSSHLFLCRRCTRKKPICRHVLLK